MHGFNSDFYTFAASVIPVVFFALMLPGCILARYARWVKQWRSRRARPIVTADKISARRLWLVLRSYDLLMLPVMATIYFTLEGELRSINALSDQHASASDQHWVTISLIGLVVIAVACTMAAISQSWAADIGTSRKSDG
jgi:Asp-tRNA(Asn)/Glu-tRNA(Gln) amidotransferase A subunit family amidase